MKRTLKPILSILLAFAMILPLAGVARADDPTYQGSTTPTISITSGTTLQSPAGNTSGATGQSITITAANVASNYGGSYVWTLSDGASAYVTGTSSTGTLTLTNVSQALASQQSFTVTLALQQDASTSISSSPLTVNVGAASVTSAAVKLTSSSVAVGGSSIATTELTYSNGVKATAATGVTYGPAANDYVTVNPTTGAITGKAPTTTSVDITATVATTVVGVASEITATAAPITVTAPTQNATATATIGTNLMMTNIYSTITGKLATSYPSAYDTLLTSGKIVLDSVPNTYGTLYLSSGTPAAAATPYDLSALASMYLTPTAAGSWTTAYTVTNGASTPTTLLTGTITVTVSTPVKNIYIPISSYGYPYTFSAATVNGSTGATLITSALSGVTYDTIVFDANKASGSVGTLYTAFTGNPTTDANSIVGNGLSKSVSATLLNGLYFDPGINATGYYAVSYTAKSGGTIVQTGELRIVINAGSLDVSFALNSNNPYTFSSASDTATGIGTGTSAYSLFTTALTNAGLSGSTYVLRFNPTTTTSYGGTLYQSSAYVNYSPLTYNTPIYVSNIGSLYFVPSQIGTYQISYGVYDSSAATTPVASGTLTITVSTVYGEADFTYSVTSGKTVTLQESDFTALLQKKLGSTYTLTDVIFNDSNGSGTFYYGGSAFAPRNSAAYYSRSYTGAVNANTRYLDGVTYTAPTSGAGYVSVRFTAYGTNTNRVTNSTTGVFHIFYSAAAVPVIDYNAYNTASTLFGTSPVVLREADFTAAYRTAMGTAATANPQFYIRLQALPTPGYGLLYQNYTSAFSTGSQLTAATVATGSYYVGRNTTVNSVSTLSYVPVGSYSALTSAYGTVDTVDYTAYSLSGTPLYTGKIRFKLAPDKTVNVYSDGLDFSAADFTSVSPTDPVLYVTFSKPASGRLYVNSNDRLIAIDENTRLYTYTPTDGAYPIGYAHYIPKADSTASVTITYTAHTRSGGTYQNSMVVAPANKTSSSKFSDVTGVTGAWSANAVDFASRYGLVGGTGNGKFSPDNSMRRADLVEILYRMAGKPSVTNAIPYTDVPSTKYYYSSSLWAARNGIMDGVTVNGKYNPEGALTRQDYARILYNYTKAMGGNVSGTNSLSAYKDTNKIASYALDAMKWAVANGYIGGMTPDTLSPTTAATRAQIVTLLYRYLTY